LLVVAEDPGLAGAVGKALAGEFRVVQARDGESALETVTREGPDVLLLDIDTPGKDGFRTCRELRARMDDRALPIIMVTASPRPEDAIRAFEVGANDYLSKPFNPGQLRAKAQTWMLRASHPGG
jgi:DNA-binding response OmpR family regulator